MDAVCPDEVCRAWIAGFFDGEGSVRIDLRTKRRGGESNSLSLRIQISNTDLETLQWLEEMYGGTVREMRKQEGYQRCYSWEISGRRSELFVLDVLPYARTKKRQLQLYVEARSLLAKPHELSKGFTEEKEMARARVSDEAQVLRRGVR